MNLVHSETKAPILVGDKLLSFRGDLYTVTGWREPQHSGSTGRVWVEGGEFFPSVLGCEFIEVAA